MIGAQLESLRSHRPIGGRHRLRRVIYRPEFGALLAALIVYAFFAWGTRGNGFVTLNGTASWMNSTAELGILAVPVALLLIGGEFDLSIGAMVGMTSIVLAAGTTHYGLPIGISILIAVLVGVAVGLINGITTVKTGLPSFIVTLGMMMAILGTSLGLARAIVGSPIVSLNTEGFFEGLFASRWRQFNVSILWWFGVAGLATWVLARTRTGNWILATGGDTQSAREAGVPTDRVKIGLFVAVSLGAVLVGIIQALEFNSGDVSRGTAFIFNTIIASVIGGVLLRGGYGSAFGAVLGAITFGVVSVGIFYTGWETDWAQLFLGVLLFAAVLANNFFRKLALSR